MGKWIICFALAACAARAFAGGTAQDPEFFSVYARLVLDEKGVPLRAERHLEITDQLWGIVERRVMGLRFEPLSPESGPKTGSTIVFIVGCIRMNDDGTADVSTQYRRHGPLLVSADGREPTLRPAFYPVEAARQGRTGTFKVGVDVNSDGRPRVEIIDSVKGSVRDFRKSIYDWVGTMRYVLEELDNLPLGFKTTLDVDYSLPKTDEEIAQSMQPASPPLSCDSDLKVLGAESNSEHSHFKLAETM